MGTFSCTCQFNETRDKYGTLHCKILHIREKWSE